jgi:4-oxalocrotonate tautomerase family enzyme
MPILTIKIPVGHSSEQKKSLLKGLSDAVVTSIGAPLPSVRVTLEEVAAEHTIVAGEIGKTMTLIDVALISGRTPEQKAALIAALSQAVEDKAGISKEFTRILLHDFPTTDMGLAGGLTAKAAGR